MRPVLAHKTGFKWKSRPSCWRRKGGRRTLLGAGPPIIVANFNTIISPVLGSVQPILTGGCIFLPRNTSSHSQYNGGNQNAINQTWIRETQKKTIFDFILPLFVNSPWNCWIMRYRPVRVRIFERDYSWISSPDGWRNSVALSTWNSNFQSVINYYSAVVSEISEQNSAKWACDFTTSFTDSGDILMM